MGSVEAVTFDYWDTIVCADPPPFKQARLDAWVSVLEAHGRPLAATAIESMLGSVFEEEFTVAWRANRQFTAGDAARAMLRRFEAEGATPFDGPLEDQLVEAFTDAGAGVSVELTRGVADAIGALKDAGIRVGIVCDVGLSPSPVLRSALDTHGLLDAFDHWSFSDEVGVYKPHSAIFEHALEGLGGVDPSRALHIGDLRRTDVAGARAMGMVAVRYTGRTDDAGEGPEGHHVLDDHGGLLALVGGGASLET